jgi:hypothetical protein
MTIPSGVTSSGTRKPPEEWDSAGKYQLIDEKPIQGMGFRGNEKLMEADSDQQDRNARKNSNNFRISSSKSSIVRKLHLKILNTKTSLK